MRLLLDENLPIALAKLLTGHHAETVRSMGWLGIANGALLDRAERHGFEAMVTSDKSIRRQNQMQGRKLGSGGGQPQRLADTGSTGGRILLALNAVTPASYHEVTLERPRTRRRRPPGPTP